MWVNNSPSGSAQSDVDRDGTPDVIDPCPADRFDGCNQDGSAAEVIDESTGGVVETDDGRLQITINPGDLASEETISITESTALDESIDLSVGTGGSAGAPLALYDLEPDGLEFEQPVTLIFELDVTDLEPAQRDDIDVYRQEDLDNDGVEETFVPLGAVCSAVEDPIGSGSFIASCEVEVNHFSVYAIVAPTDTDGDGVFDNFNGVVDACPLEDSTGFDVDDDGCVDSIDGLSSMVSQLVFEGIIDTTMENSLISKVTNAQNSLDREKICTAENQLQSFKAQVIAQTGKKISTDASADILAYADSVIAYLMSQMTMGETCN